MTVGAASMLQETDLSINSKKMLNVSPDDFDVLLKHYNISKKSLEDMIKNIRDWYDKQPHLPQGYLHDRLIIGHLISRAFSVERAKEKIDNCLSAKHKMPELVCDRDPLSPELSKHLRQGYWVVLPKKTPDNHRVSIFKMHDKNIAPVVDMIKIAFMIIEYRFWNDVYLGDIWIIDFTNLNISLALQMTPVLISKVMFYMTGCFGGKVRGIHLVNLPPYAVSALTLFKKAMKTKLVDRIHIHTKFEDTLKIFPKEIIPKDFGGDEMSMQELTDEMVNTFQTKQWRQFFIQQDLIKTNESKRIMKTEADEIFGINGSFRKLDLD